MALRNDVRIGGVMKVMKDGDLVGFVGRVENGYFWTSAEGVGAGRLFDNFTRVLEIPANKYNCKLAALTLTEQ